MTLQELLKENYREGMTAEEIAKALGGVEEAPAEPFSEPTQTEQLKREVEKWKNAANKASKEAADQKRASQARMTEEELRAAEYKAKQDELTEKIAELERKTRLTDSQTKYLTFGYGTEMAEKAAIAFADGDLETMLLIQRQYSEQIAKNQRAEALKTTPKPSASGASGASVPKDITREQFDKMQYKELLALKNENPELYNELNGG